MKKIKIGKRIIGKNYPVFIIAEAGVNHNGELKIAKKLVDAAKESGADAVKFQTFKTEKLITEKAPKANYHIKNVGKKGSWFNLLKSQELSKEDHRRLMDHCRKKNIIFLSTPYDEESADFLYRAGVPAYKISSCDINNIPFLKHLSKKGLPVLLSTGMSYEKEVTEAVKALLSVNKIDIVLFQCTSDYPSKESELNLRVMDDYSKRYGFPVGFSDHSLNKYASILALGMGMNVYEKHLTLDKRMKGPDHCSSSNPCELREIINNIRVSEIMLGEDKKKPSFSEIKNRDKMRKSIVSACEIKKGQRITKDLIAIKRPGTGLSPIYFKKILNKKAKRLIKKDQAVKKEDVL